MVPDLDGTGTVLLTAGPHTVLQHAFGVDSAARHEELGAHRLDLDLPRLRRDVDTAAGLSAARGLGLGRATSELLAHMGTSLNFMQGSVHEFDPTTGAGSVLLDDGRRVPSTPTCSTAASCGCCG